MTQSVTPAATPVQILPVAAHASDRSSDRPADSYWAVERQLSVIVPTFNERDNVTKLFHKLEATLAGVAWEVVFVDDNSPTEPGTWFADWRERDTRVRCLRPDRASRPVGRLHRRHPGLERSLCGRDRRRSAAR